MNYKHGHNRKGFVTKTYTTWQSMLQRCCDIGYKNYSRYGGRGITVCDRWRHSFENFLQDMGEKPEGLTLERVNNDGPYCKENCVWATRTQQARNRRSSRRITLNGKTMTMAEWSELTGIPVMCIYTRLNHYGWSVERALTQKVDKEWSITKYNKMLDERIESIPKQCPTTVHN